jgi:hypothetical protein
MKHLSVLFRVFLLQIIGLTSFSQDKVVLEQIQTYSTIHPSAKYWQIPSNFNTILNAIDSGLFNSLQLVRETSIQPINKELKKQSQLGKIMVDWSKSSAYPFHAYLELYEMDPALVYSNNWVNIPESKKDSIHSIWYIACNIYNQKQEKVFGKTILVAILPIHTLGMGQEILTTGSVPSNIYQAIAKAIHYMSPKMGNMEYIEAKMPSAYATDNYWMPIIHNQPRIIFDTTKKFIAYSNSGVPQLLRTPEAVLNKINTKDKSTDNPYKEVIDLIRKTKSGFNNKEFYQVIQPLRDVQGNIDYTIQAFIEFNGESMTNDYGKKNFIEFLSDSVHTLFQDKKNIGVFIVKENSIEPNKYFFPDIVYNGYDSTKSFSLGTFYAKQPIVHSRVIEGKVHGLKFSIKLDFENNIKTISLEDTIIMVVGGDKKPMQMVLADKNTPTSIVNLLLLIAYSEIFQRPS